MSFPYAKFVVIPQQHYEEMASVYYNQQPQPTAGSSDVSLKDDPPMLANDQGHDDLSVEDNGYDSDCVIIGEIKSKPTNETIPSSVQQQQPSTSDACHASSSFTLPAMDRTTPNFNCIVLLDRLKPAELAQYSVSTVMQHGYDDSHSTSSMTERRLLSTNYRQQFRSLAKLIGELADFDFPTNRPLTTDDVDSWCIKKATDMINNSKKKT